MSENLKPCSNTGFNFIHHCRDVVNDAAVFKSADAGIAMGGLASDTTIEAADVVIQNVQPH